MPLDFWPLGNAERLAWAAVADVVAPPPPPDYEAWAVRHVEFGNESQFPGRYDPKRFPFFGPILAALSPEDASRNVTLLGSAQIGKSVLCQVFVAASLDLDPGNVIYYHPTESNATEWARTKWKPMLRQTRRLRELLGEERSRDGGQSLLFYERRDGLASLIVAGANSGPAVSMKSARNQVQDDLSKWEVLPSGDSETQADSRSKAFLFAKVLKAGTPLIEPGCRTTRNFRAGTQEHWHVPCPHCQHVQELTWENMLASTDAEDPGDAHFTCASCNGRIENHHLAWMNEHAVELGGGFKAENPKAKDRSFYLWAALVPLESWENIFRAWLKAEGNPAAEQVFYNDTVGRAYKSAGESPPYEEIRDRATATGHRLGLIPASAALIFTAGCDCQKDRVEVHLKGFGKDGRRATVEYRVLEGHISTDKTRAALDALLEETWPDEYGNQRRVDMLAIDGNAWTDDVMQWARRHSWNRVIVTRGAKSENAPPLQQVQSERKLDGKPKRQQKRFYNLGVSGLKSVLYVALGKKDQLERGYCAYPQGLEDDFFQQLCAERREPKRTRDGFTVYRWVKDPSQRNEVLDTELIAEGAAVRCGWRALTDKTAAELEARLIAAGTLAREAMERQPDLLDRVDDKARAIHQAATGAPLDTGGYRRR